MFSGHNSHNWHNQPPLPWCARPRPRPAAALVDGVFDVAAEDFLPNVADAGPQKKERNIFM